MFWRFMGMTEKWCEGDGEDICSYRFTKVRPTFEIDNEGTLSFPWGNLESDEDEKN